MSDARLPQDRHQPLHPAAARPQSIPTHAPTPPPADDAGALELEPLEEADDTLEPLTLVDTDGTSTASKIRAFGVGNATRPAAAWKRHTKAPGTGAIRVRSFHGKFSEQGLDFMDNQINEWLDNHPEIEIKFVTSAVGQFEGKIREPALVLNVWY